VFWPPMVVIFREVFFEGFITGVLTSP